jgi:ethanolamine-phosphate phospho-lyase
MIAAYDDMRLSLVSSHHTCHAMPCCAAAHRGEGCYITDAAGERYLDTCNNVACVGHSHPRVVQQGQMALAQIQTNQRFLHPIQQQYLAKLLSTFPPELSTVYLVNSGSEANDLALRIARACTTAARPEDVIVLDGAYHGHTSALIDLSPYKWAQATDGKNRKKDFVHVVTCPDPYCGEHVGMTQAVGEEYAREVQAEVGGAAGGVGCFFAEGAMGCAGQILLPPGYLSSCYAAVRATGGICIADEVRRCP